MIDLNKMAEQAIANIIASGTIENKIEDSISETVGSIISDTFRSYGDFGKELKKALQEQLKIDFSNLDLPIYNEYVLQSLKEIINTQLEERGIKELESHISDVFGETVQKEYNLRDIIEIFKGSERDYKEYGDTFTLIIEGEDDGYKHVYLDEDDGTRKYECGYRMALDKEGIMYNLEIKDKNMNSSSNLINNIGNFAKFLVRIKAAGSKIAIDEMDADYYDTNYIEED